MPLRVGSKIGDLYKDKEEQYYWIVDKRKDTNEYFLSLVHFPGEMDIKRIDDLEYVGNIDPGELANLLHGGNHHGSR